MTHVAWSPVNTSVDKRFTMSLDLSMLSIWTVFYSIGTVTCKISFRHQHCLDESYADFTWYFHIVLWIPVPEYPSTITQASLIIREDAFLHVLVLFCGVQVSGLEFFQRPALRPILDLSWNHSRSNAVYSRVVLAWTHLFLWVNIDASWSSTGNSPVVVQT
jgi:hypothetical protein